MTKIDKKIFCPKKVAQLKIFESDYKSYHFYDSYGNIY